MDNNFKISLKCCRCFVGVRRKIVIGGWMV